MLRRIDYIEPLRSHRFCTTLGFAGCSISTSSVQFKLGLPWSGPGRLVIVGQLGKPMVELLNGPPDSALWIGLYTRDDDIEKPAAFVLAEELDLPNARVELTNLDCEQDKILRVTAEVSYKRLNVIFGATLLDALAAI